MDIQLDRKTKPKTRVVVRLTLPNVKAYHAHEAEIKQLAERIDASLAVKME